VAFTNHFAGEETSLTGVAPCAPDHACGSEQPMAEIRKKFLPKLNTEPNSAVLGEFWMMLYKSPSALVPDKQISAIGPYKRPFLGRVIYPCMTIYSRSAKFTGEIGRSEMVAITNHL
jgi:hypothetical protein